MVAAGPSGAVGEEWARLRYLPGHSKGRRREVYAVESRHWAQLQKGPNKEEEEENRERQNKKEEGEEERNLEVERDGKVIKTSRGQKQKK